MCELAAQDRMLVPRELWASLVSLPSPQACPPSAVTFALSAMTFEEDCSGRPWREGGTVCSEDKSAQQTWARTLVLPACSLHELSALHLSARCPCGGSRGPEMTLTAQRVFRET